MYSMKRKTVHDDARIDYIKQHLSVIADAIADGANVKDTSYGLLWMYFHGQMVMKKIRFILR